MNRYLSPILISIVTGLYLSTVQAADKAAESAKKPTYRFSGDAELLSQFEERGLAITDKNPALTASFLFNMGQQFRVGFWGSNISHLSAVDDNLWLKVLAEVQIDFSRDSIFKMYFHDDHFYKSDIRNGQSVGITYEFASHQTQAEWKSNFEGTKTDSIYVKYGRLFVLYKEIVTGASIGYTLQKSNGYKDYIDFKAFSNYKLSDFFEVNASLTYATNSSQFNGRGDPALAVGIRLSY